MAVLSKRVVTIPSSMHYFHPCTLCIILVLLLIPPDVETDSPVLTPASVLTATRSQCVVAISNIQNGVDLQSLLTIADVAFREEPKVLVGVADLHDFVWPSGKRLQIEGDESKAKAAVFLVEPEDRTCLLKPTYYKVYPESVGYFGPSFDDVFVEFINSHCNTFRRPDGFLNQKGLHRQYLMENLFSVKECPDSIPISEIFRKQSNKHQQEFCMREVGQSSAVCADPSKKTSSTVFADVPKCERIPLPSKEDFFNNFLARSKPVIITGAMDSWPALSKWTNEFFMKQYGTKEVHIKLTPKGEYEGVESASIWESFGTFRIPADVLKQLPYPDLVVVRPAVIDMNVSEFLTLIQNISEGVFTNVSAYLEYTSVADYFPELKEDLTEMPFFLNVLKLAHLNIWLSDGNTLGKTHFDPFDNFLCQISGEKEVILFEPHNDFLYEAHIPEAILSYNATLKQFRRSTLLDSTSMVMTPVDILQPHLERFPKFGAARPMSCTIREGDVLFMPAFWWHEVQSRPSISQRRNLAVNFWYEPFFKKEFPCPDCQLDVNPQYSHLL